MIGGADVVVCGMTRTTGVDVKAPVEISGEEP